MILRGWSFHIISSCELFMLMSVHNITVLMDEIQKGVYQIMDNNVIFLYIDPGTGSMLFTILLGVIGSGMFFMKKLVMKIKFRLSGGKTDVSADTLPYPMLCSVKAVIIGQPSNRFAMNLRSGGSM